MGEPEPVPETEAALVPCSLRRPFKCREIGRLDGYYGGVETNTHGILVVSGAALLTLRVTPPHKCRVAPDP